MTRPVPWPGLLLVALAALLACGCVAPPTGALAPLSFNIAFPSLEDGSYPDTFNLDAEHDAWEAVVKFCDHGQRLSNLDMVTCAFNLLGAVRGARWSSPPRVTDHLSLHS